MRRVQFYKSVEENKLMHVISPGSTQKPICSRLICQVSRVSSQPLAAPTPAGVRRDVTHLLSGGRLLLRNQIACQRPITLSPKHPSRKNKQPQSPKGRWSFVTGQTLISWGNFRVVLAESRVAVRHSKCLSSQDGKGLNSKPFWFCTSLNHQQDNLGQRDRLLQNGPGESSSAVGQGTGDSLVFSGDSGTTPFQTQVKDRGCGVWIQGPSRPTSADGNLLPLYQVDSEFLFRKCSHAKPQYFSIALKFPRMSIHHSIYYLIYTYSRYYKSYFNIVRNL